MDLSLISKLLCTIWQFYTTVNVLQAITQTEISYTKSGKPKGISGRLEGLKGFGHKFLSINKDLLKKPFNDFENQLY